MANQLLTPDEFFARLTASFKKGIATVYDDPPPGNPEATPEVGANKLAVDPRVIWADAAGWCMVNCVESGDDPFDDHHPNRVAP